MVRVLKAIGTFFLDIIQTIVLALSVFIIIYLFLVQPHQVKGSSMYPNFHDGEFILTNKVSYRFGSPKRGDVIIFKAPAGEPCAEIECEYIKRIIGLPGDRVKVQGGSVFVNGSKLNESYLANGIYVSPGSYLLENLEKEIPEGEYLALGDNRSQSRDGREFGPISKEDIIGKAWVRYLPFDRVGAIKAVEY